MVGAATASPIDPAVLERLRPALEHDPADIVVNPAGQKTVVAFLDYRCGKCKASAPALYALVERRPDVRLVIKQYPYWGGFSETAAAVMSSPAARSKGLPLHRQLMSETRLDAAVLRSRLTEAGIDADAAFAEAKSPTLRRHMDQTKTLVSELHIEGTPAFVVGGMLVSGPDISQVEAALPRS
jgi:protein-disulfide isomerase